MNTRRWTVQREKRKKRKVQRLSESKKEVGRRRIERERERNIHRGRERRN